MEAETSYFRYKFQPWNGSYNEGIGPILNMLINQVKITRVLAFREQIHVIKFFLISSDYNYLIQHCEK